MLSFLSYWNLKSWEYINLAVALHYNVSSLHLFFFFWKLKMKNFSSLSSFRDENISPINHWLESNKHSFERKHIGTVIYLLFSFQVSCKFIEIWTMILNVNINANFKMFRLTSIKQVIWEYFHWTSNWLVCFDSKAEVLTLVDARKVLSML